MVKRTQTIRRLLIYPKRHDTVKISKQNKLYNKLKFGCNTYSKLLKRLSEKLSGVISFRK